MPRLLVTSMVAIVLGVTSAHGFEMGKLNPWNNETEETPGISVTIPEVDIGNAWAATVGAGAKGVDIVKGGSGKAIEALEVSRDWASEKWDKRGDIRWNPLPEGWVPSSPLPEGWDVVGWLPVEGISSGMAAISEDERVVQTRVMISSEIDKLPKDPGWWRDAGIAAAVTGASVGAANAGCVMLTTPGGPVVMAVAGGACGIAASRGSAIIIEKGYGMAGATPNAEAFAAGVRIGTVVGTFGGSYLSGGNMDLETSGTFRTVKDGFGKAAGYLDAWMAPKEPSSPSGHAGVSAEPSTGSTQAEITGNR